MGGAVFVWHLHPPCGLSVVRIRTTTAKDRGNFLYGKDSGTSVHSDPRSHYMTNRQIKAMLTQAALGCHHIQSSYGELLYPTRGTWEEEAGRTEQCQEDRYSDR